MHSSRMRTDRSFTGGCAWQGGMHGGGGVDGRGVCVWQGACMAGGMRGRDMRGRGAWMAEGVRVMAGVCMHGRGRAWQEHAWQRRHA